jgi:hypothetical protein
VRTPRLAEARVDNLESGFDQHGFEQGAMRAVLVDQMPLEFTPYPPHAAIRWRGAQPRLNHFLELPLRGGEDQVAQEEDASGDH